MSKSKCYNFLFTFQFLNSSFLKNENGEKFQEKKMLYTVCIFSISAFIYIFFQFFSFFLRKIKYFH